jgi:uncharacterized membrane protein
MIFSIVVLVGFLLYITPRVARPGLFFGVTVDSAFVVRDAARRIQRRYGLEIIAHSGHALALVFALRPAVGLLWQVFGAGWAFANAHRAATPYASSSEGAIREAGLDPQPEDSLFVTALALAPLALLFLLALYVRSQWDQIPDRFPVHFGFHGPDRWVTRSPRAVYGLIALNGLLCGLMLMTRYGLRHGSRRVAIDGAPAQAEARFRRIITWLLVAVEYLMVMLTWAILFSSPQGVFVFGIGMLVLTVVLVFVLMRMGQGGNRLASGGPAGDRTPDACWKWGMIYINPSDPALFVEKRFGVGYTVNFGNRWSWIFLIITLLPLVVVRFYLR